MGITIPRQLVLNYIIKLPKLHPNLPFVRVFYHRNRIKHVRHATKLPMGGYSMIHILQMKLK